MKGSLTIVAGIFLVGCCSNKQLASETNEDVKTEVRERVVYRDTIIYKEVPQESQAQTVRDTTSHLETSVAVSDARINSDGSLSHSLENKPILFKINFKMPELHRNSVVYRNIYRVNTVEVPRPLTWWQQAQIKGFWAMVVILVLWVFTKKKINFFMRIFGILKHNE